MKDVEEEEVNIASNNLKQMHKDLAEISDLYGLANIVSNYMAEGNLRVYEAVEAENAEALFLVNCEYSFIHALASKFLELFAKNDLESDHIFEYTEDLLDQIEKAQLHFQSFDSNKNPINENIH